MTTIKKNIMLIDIDGTFVYDSSEVSKEDLNAFKEAEKYCYMGIATGRSVDEIAYIEQENNLKLDYRIGFNGALIINQENDVLYNKPIAKATLSALIDYLEEHQLIFDALDGKTRLGNFKHEDKNQLLGLEYQYLSSPYAAVRTKNVYKINLRPDTLASAGQMTKELKERFSDLSIFQVGQRRIEISAANTSKGKALLKIAETPLKTIAIGDSENDISMFQQAEVSYCMEHAPAYVKETATFVVPRFSDAVTHFINMQEGK
jgi:Cof subfamily protein (haloacid dehalogenase superfamily)